MRTAMSASSEPKFLKIRQHLGGIENESQPASLPAIEVS
jgi:hypothetical protein